MPLEEQEIINQKVTLELITQETPLYKIALRELSLGIRIPFTDWRIPIGGAHLFWVRYNDTGDIIDELHGLSCDRTTKKFKAIGWSGDILKVIQYSHKEQSAVPNVGEFYGLYRTGQTEKIVKIGTEDEITDCWNKALQAARQLNALNINYELLGRKLNSELFWDKLFGKVDNNIQEGNSNSIVYTLGELMGFTTSALSYKLTPGLGKNLLSTSWEKSEIANREVAMTDVQSVESNAMIEIAGEEGVVPKIIISEG